MTDNIYGSKIKREHEPTRYPVLKEYPWDYKNLDPELKRLRYVMINPSADNREYAFWNDSISQSFSIMTSSLIMGDGLKINCTNYAAKQLIKEFNENINVNGLSIDDYVARTWNDQLVHANDFWRILIDKDYATKVDIQRLDPKTITLKRDNHRGWTKLIQRVPNYKSYNSKKQFYRKAELTDDLLLTYNGRMKEIHIPDEPDVILRNTFFMNPPINTALHYIIYKRFILYFMRKYSQRLWTPLMFFLIGDPTTNYYPQDPEDMQRRIDDMGDVVEELTSFSCAALQGDTKIVEAGQNSARSSAVFVDYINMLDKQIMMAEFGSMGLRDASGSELATSRTLKEIYLQFIGGIRRKYKARLENFYTKCLCKANGIKLSPIDIEIEFSPLKFEATREYMQGVDLAVKSGVFKDRNEVRKAAQVLWGWLDELDGKQNTKIQFPIDNMIKQAIAPKPKQNSTGDRIQEYLNVRKF